MGLCYVRFVFRQICNLPFGGCGVATTVLADLQSTISIIPQITNLR